MLSPSIAAAPTNLTTTVLTASVTPLIAESSLLARVHLGDEAAMTHLYDAYSKLVFSSALRVLNDRAAAEDVLQDVFLRMWRRPASFVAARGSLGSWLTIIARNRAIDMVRRQRRTENVDDVPLMAAGNLSSEVEVAVLADRVKSLIAKLSAGQQEALELAYFKGWTHLEIAENTQTPLGTVKTRIRTALRTLRTGMQSPEI